MSDTHDHLDSNLGPLYEEHLLLGVRFGDAGEPLSYVGEEVGSPVCLCDVSSLRMLLFAGAPAPTFAHAAFAGRELAVGACAFEAVLTGDGGIASIPLLARTGDLEYVVMDGSPRADVLDGWLSFLSNVEQGGVRPFAGLECSDVSGSHVCLALWGPGALEVLSDYIHDGEELPASASIAACHLDAIPSLVCRHATDDGNLFLVLVPPHTAVPLWRSFLSFTQVAPVGTEALGTALASEFGWSDDLGQQGALRIDATRLERYGLIRDNRDFVGARGLA